MTEMTSHRNKVVGVAQRTVEKYMEKKLLSKVGDNIII
jgi:hypothetical protein